MKKIEQAIIDQANIFCKKSFMDFPDYDEANPITNLADALTVLIFDSFDNDEFDSSEVYDLLDEKLNVKNEVEKAKKTLKSDGYFIDNLWTITDVQENYECTEDEAQEVLNGALTNDATMEQIWFAIHHHAEENGLKKL